MVGDALQAGVQNEVLKRGRWVAPKGGIVEGIASKPRFAWTPTEIEFFDQVSKQVQSFRVEGMEFAQPRCLKLSLDAETGRLGRTRP